MNYADLDTQRSSFTTNLPKEWLAAWCALPRHEVFRIGRKLLWAWIRGRKVVRIELWTSGIRINETTVSEDVAR